MLVRAMLRSLVTGSLTVIVHGDEVVGVLWAGRDRPDFWLVPVACNAAQRVTVRIKLQHLDLYAQ